MFTFLARRNAMGAAAPAPRRLPRQLLASSVQPASARPRPSHAVLSLPARVLPESAPEKALPASNTSTATRGKPTRAAVRQAPARWSTKQAAPAVDVAALLSVLQALVAQTGSQTSTAELESKLAAEVSAKESLQAKLSTVEAECLSLRAMLDEQQRDSDVLRSIDQAHCYTQGVLYSQLRQRDQQMVALRLRLERVKRNPTCLDLESDPSIERDAISVVRDDYVKQLHRENAELLNSLRKVQHQLEVAEAAAAAHTA